MTSDNTAIRTPISAQEYIVLNRMPKGRHAYGLIFEAWGSWQEEKLARDWANQHCNSLSCVNLLHSPERWQHELKSVLPEQSTGTQRSLPHMVVLIGEGKRNVIGPLFFPVIVSAKLLVEVYLHGLGKQACEALVPFLDYRRYPDKAFKMDSVTGLYLLDSSRR